MKIDNYDQEIAPLMIISFVENAFKYSSILRGTHHPILIKLHLKDSTLNFSCQNPFKKNGNLGLNPTWKKSGVGIANTQKRLEYVYPKRHALKIDDQAGVFTVTLKIKL